MDINDILTIVLAFAALVVSLITYIKSVVHDRKRDTLDAFNTLQNEAFDKLNLLMPVDIQEIAKHPTSKEYKEISGYIARIEHFCVGVNMEIYDRETVYQLANGYLDSNTILSRIEPIIDKKQRSAEKDYYENIHKVLAWMQTKSNRAIDRRKEKNHEQSE